MLTPAVRRTLEIGQVLGLVALLAGLYLIAGLAWALIVGGLVLAALCVLAELSRQRTDKEGSD